MNKINKKVNMRRYINIWKDIEIILLVMTMIISFMTMASVASEEYKFPDDALHVGIENIIELGPKEFIEKTSPTGIMPIEAWNKTYIYWCDNSSSMWMSMCGIDASSVQQTTDAGYIIAGRWFYADFEGSLEGAWLIKVDSSGNKQWNKIFYGGDWGTGANSVQQISDGGYILAGSKCTAFSNIYGCINVDAWLIKTDGSGNIKWNKTFGGTSDDAINSVQQTTDGGYILAGYTGSDGWLIKVDSIGNKQWDKTFGGTDDVINSVRQTKDGGYITAGTTYGAGNSDARLIKTDGSGNIKWSKTFGGPNRDGINSVRQTKDGGYITAGYTESYGASNSDAWLIKTDGSGNIKWSKTFGGPNRDGIDSVRQTKDGGYITAGYIEGNWTVLRLRYQIIKTDSLGNQQWNKISRRGTYSELSDVQQTKDGSYIFAGSIGLANFGTVSPKALLVKITEKNESNITNFKLPLPGNRSWLLTVQAKDGKTLWGGVDQYHVNRNALDFDDVTKENAQLYNVPILAAADGTVVESGYSTYNGNYVKIRHNNNLNSTYLHMANLPLVNRGNIVIQGQQIGILGNTGNSNGSHIHFEIQPSSATNFLIEGKSIDYYKVGTVANKKYYPSTNRVIYPTVVSPNGGETWRIGTTQTIRWSVGDSGQNVKIVSLKGNVENSVIISSTPNDGSYTWTIPLTQPLGSDYKIRIISTSNAAYSDRSDNTFRIY